MSKINESIRALTDELKASIVKAGGIEKILSEGGKVSKDVFAELLPKIDESITTEQVEAVCSAIATYGTAGTLATGELATEAAKKNAELKDVTMIYGLTGQDTASVKWLRDKDQRTPGKDETKLVHGSTRTSFDIYQLGGNRGQMAAVRAHLLELGAAELGE